jgi:hypothetical protein
MSGDEQSLRLAASTGGGARAWRSPSSAPSPPHRARACATHRDLSPRNVIGMGPVRGSENQHRPHRSYVPDEGSVSGRSEFEPRRVIARSKSRDVQRFGEPRRRDHAQPRSVVGVPVTPLSHEASVSHDRRTHVRGTRHDARRSGATPPLPRPVRFAGVAVPAPYTGYRRRVARST